MGSSPAAWTYLGLHGMYGMLWLVKVLLYDMHATRRSWLAPRKKSLGGSVCLFFPEFRLCFGFEQHAVTESIEGRPCSQTLSAC